MSSVTVCACTNQCRECGACCQGGCEHRGNATATIILDGPHAVWTSPVGHANEAYAGDAGSKADAGKTRVDLLPFEALVEVAEVMTFGAGKYGERNWHGLSVSRLFAASLRHLWAWWTGEDADPETGRPHLAHAGCCVLMALEQMLKRAEYDDRPS